MGKQNEVEMARGCLTSLFRVFCTTRMADMDPDEVIAKLDAAHDDLGHKDPDFDNLMDRVAIEDAVSMITKLNKENARLTKNNEALRQAMNIKGLYED